MLAVIDSPKIVNTKPVAIKINIGVSRVVKRNDTALLTTLPAPIDVKSIRQIFQGLFTQNSTTITVSKTELKLNQPQVTEDAFIAALIQYWNNKTKTLNDNPDFIDSSNLKTICIYNDVYLDEGVYRFYYTLYAKKHFSSQYELPADSFTTLIPSDL